jgi:hypothetical protein
MDELVVAYLTDGLTADELPLDCCGNDRSIWAGGVRRRIFFSAGFSDAHSKCTSAAGDDVVCVRHAR